MHVRLELSVPGEDVIVSHELNPDMTGRSASRSNAEGDDHHRDVQVAIREAFDVARRRLEDLARLQRGDIKTHIATP